MKYTTKLARNLVLCSVALLFACDSDHSTSSPSTKPTSCGDPNLHLREISFVFDGTFFNFESLASVGNSTVVNRGWLNSDYTIMFGSSGGAAHHSLLLKLPRYQSGTYTWGDRTVDAEGYGLQLEMDSLRSSGSVLSLRSLSGTTEIKVYDNPGDDNDSLFGTFCGTVKDDSGKVFTITDGQFYYIERK